MIYRKGDRVIECKEPEAGPGTIVDVLPGMYPYVVEWDAGGTTREARDAIERAARERPAGDDATGGGA
jgi:hypothetical protein